MDMFPSGEKINAYISEQIHAGASVNTNHRGIEYACRIHQNSLPYLDVCKAGQERGQGTWDSVGSTIALAKFVWDMWKASITFIIPKQRSQV